MKQVISIVSCLLIAGCASTPKPTPVATAAQPAKVNAPATTKVAATPVAPLAPGEKLTPERILSLQKSGYKLVDKNGNQYFCKTEAKTGTHVARDTVCMTAQEAEALRELTQRRMGDFVRQQPPPQGK